MLRNRPTSQPDDNHPQENHQPPRTSFVRTFGLNTFLVVLLCFALIAVYEKTAPQNIRLSTLLGQFEGNTESEALKASIEGLNAKLAAEKAAEEKMQNDVN